MKKFSDTVTSLIAASLGLPGMQNLLAQEAPQEGISYQFTHYDEAPLPANRLASFVGAARICGRQILMGEADPCMSGFGRDCS